MAHTDDRPLHHISTQELEEAIGRAISELAGLGYVVDILNIQARPGHPCAKTQPTLEDGSAHDAYEIYFQVAKDQEPVADTIKRLRDEQLHGNGS